MRRLATALMFVATAAFYARTGLVRFACYGRDRTSATKGIQWTRVP